LEINQKVKHIFVADVVVNILIMFMIKNVRFADLVKLKNLEIIYGQEDKPKYVCYYII